MNMRRAIHVLGVGIFVVTAAHRVGAHGTVDVEGSGYTGSGSGSWICGPSAGVHYGGLGAEVRVHGHVNDPGHVEGGPAVTAGAVAESREYTRLPCANTGCGAHATDAIPPSTWMGAGHVQVGYDWRVVGVRGGVLVWERYGSSGESSPDVNVLPELALRLGPQVGGHAVLGGGSSDLATLLRPGVYAGGGYTTDSGWDVSGTLGAHMVFDGEMGLRGELSVRAPVTPDLQLGASAALSTGAADRVEPEGRLSIIGHL